MKKQSNLLQETLDRISVSHRDISQRYETEVITVRQQADTLQQELEEEVKSHADTVLNNLQMISHLRAEQDDLCHRMTKEINDLQQDTLEKEEQYDRHVAELNRMIAIQLSIYLKLSRELKALKEAAPAPEHLDVPQIPEENLPDKPKKICLENCL